MHDRHTTRWILVATLALLTAGAWGQDTRGYEDPLAGYTLNVPREALRLSITREQRRAGRLAQWIIVDKDTGLIEWSLSVDNAMLPGVQSNLEAWLDAEIGQQLRSEPGFKMSRSKATRISGYPALEISGTQKQLAPAAEPAAPQPELAVREAWIETGTQAETFGEPKRTRMLTTFLTIRLVGLDEKTIDRQWAQVVSGLRVTDPDTALDAIRKATDNAATVVADLRDRKTLSDLLPDESHWFLLRKDTKPIGWVVVKTGPETRTDQMDWGLRRFSMTREEGNPTRFESRGNFTERNLDVERWYVRTELILGEAQSRILVEQGLRQDQQVFAETIGAGSRQSRTEALSPFVRSIYLPRVAYGALPKLLDLSKPASYCFAEYSSETDEFTRRNIEVVGPVLIKQDGRDVRVTKIVDTPNFNEKPRTLYVDAKGNVVRQVFQGGYVLEAVTRAEVQREYPQTNAIIKELMKLEP